MTGKCPYCANTTPCEFEPATVAPDAPLIMRCGHCRRVLGATPNLTAVLSSIESLRAEVAALREALGRK